ncbi:MAG: nucleotidyltransferase domain-containing protein [Candidatus Bathyarchaeia archaeon]
MDSKRRLEYDLSSLIEEISSIREVIAIILFGSRARGDYDEYSDYDLLVVFTDRESMWRRWSELFQKVGSFSLLVHLIPKSLSEFTSSEPTFLGEVLKHGRLLYSKYPFQSSLVPLNLQRVKIISYSMRRLKQEDKMRLIYRLYGKKGDENKGLVKKLRGLKVCEGCIIMPEENAGAVLEALRKQGVEVKSFDAYIPRDKLELVES